jgi:hypothetical protein
MTRLARKMLMSAVIQYLENLDDGELSEVASTAQRMESTVRVLGPALSSTDHELPDDVAPIVPIPDPETVN